MSEVVLIAGAHGGKRAALDAAAGEVSKPAPEGAYRTTAGGLVVPAEFSREREVWTRDEFKVLERATKLLSSRGVTIFLRCERPECRVAPMQRIRNADGGITLRCEHKDRVFVKL